jgi:hypothetical protein
MLAPLSTRSGSDTIGSSQFIVDLEFLQEFDLFLNCSSNSCPVSGDFSSPVKSSPGPSSRDGGFMSPCRVVLSTSSDPIGHLSSCFYEPHDHLILCPMDPVNHRLDLIDEHFPIRSHVSPEHRLFDQESREHSVLDLDSSQQETGTHLSRVEQNLMIGQKRHLQSSHSFDKSLPLRDTGKSSNLVNGVCNSQRSRQSDVDLMYEQLKRDSIIAQAGWDYSSILASLSDDVDCVYSAAATPLVNNFAQPNSSSQAAIHSSPAAPAPILNMNSGGIHVNSVSPAFNLEFLNTSVHSGDLTSHQVREISRGREAANNCHQVPISALPSSFASNRGRVEQINHISGPVQYFFNIGGINFDPSVSIGDFLNSISRATTGSQAGGGLAMQGASVQAQGNST